jgi:hypothetical protein
LVVVFFFRRSLRDMVVGASRAAAPCSILVLLIALPAASSFLSAPLHLRPSSRLLASGSDGGDPGRYSDESGANFDVEKVSLWTSKDIYRDLNNALASREIARNVESEKSVDTVYCGKKMKEMYYRYAFLSNTKGKSSDMLPVTSNKGELRRPAFATVSAVTASSGGDASDKSREWLDFAAEAELKHSRMALFALAAYMAILTQHVDGTVNSITDLYSSLQGHEWDIALDTWRTVVIMLACVEAFYYAGIGKMLQAKMTEAVQATIQVSDSACDLIEKSELGHGRVALLLVSAASTATFLPAVSEFITAAVAH